MIQLNLINFLATGIFKRNILCNNAAGSKSNKVVEIASQGIRAQWDRLNFDHLKIALATEKLSSFVG